MSLMVVLALFVRRRSYELFLYTHALAIGVFVTVLVHAWSAWFFLMPPLLFWLLDKALRTCRTRAAPVLALDTGCGGITRGLAFCLFVNFNLALSWHFCLNEPQNFTVLSL